MTATETIPCAVCGNPIDMPAGQVFGWRPKSLTCNSCIEAKKLQEEAAKLEAVEKHRQDRIQAILADVPAALAACGVPLAWQGVDFDKMPDIHTGLISKVREWAQGPQGMLFLFGTPGSGKTWTAVAAIREILLAGIMPVDAIRFIGERAYLDGLKAAFAQDGKPASSRALASNDPRRVHFLVFDDLCSTRATDWTVGEIAALVEDRYAQGLPTIFTSNIHPDNLGTALDPRILSRIAESRLLIQFPNRDLRTSGSLTSRKMLFDFTK